MFKLNTLTALTKKRKRVGRGGSRGGTSGRGSKGQKARTGDSGVGYGFEGGQMPISRRLPKRGFTNAPFKKVFTIINTSDLDRCFNDGDEVTIERLIEVGLIKAQSSQVGLSLPRVKLLGTGKLNKKLTIHVDAASQGARGMIEQSDGIIHFIKER